MNAADFLKGPCQHCGNSIEFPADGTGQTTTCPHCGQATKLLPDATPPPDAAAIRKRSPAAVISAIVIALVVFGAVVAFQSLRKPAGPKFEATPSTTTEQVDAPANKTHPVDEITPSTKTAKPKSPDDLKHGAITFEKARGSSLVYAVGVLRNESEHQRFGVNIELELTDARGNKVGTAKDYRAVLEPRQEWRFRALVLDSKAATATVLSIREE